MSDRRTVLGGYLSVLSGDIGRLLVFAAFIPLLVRIVQSDGFGQYALVMAIFAPSRKLLNFGLFEATKTFLSRQDTDHREIIGTSLLLHLLVLTAGLTVLVLTLSITTPQPWLRQSLLFVGAALIGEQLFLFGRGVLHANRREELVEPLIFIRSVLLAAIGLWLATKSGVPGVFAGFAAGFLSTGLVATLVALSETAGWPQVSRRHLTPLLRFGAPSMALTLLLTGLYKTDVLLMSYFRTAAETGQYRAALQVSEFVWVAPLAMQLVTIQSVADLWVDGERDRITALTARRLRYVLALTALLVTGVFVLSPPFVRLYFGTGFEGTVRPLRILLPGVLGFAVARVVWPVLQAGGFLRQIVLATAVAFALNLGFNLLLIPWIGATGAAVATSLSYLLMGGAHVTVARRSGIDPLADGRVVRIIVSAVGTGMLLGGIRSLVNPSVALIVLPPIGLLAFGILSWATGVLGADEYRRGWEMLRAPF